MGVTRRGSEVLVNTTTSGSQNLSGFVTLANGNLVVIWQDRDAAFFTPTDIRGQVFDANMAKVGGEFVVNTSNAGEQGGAQVIALGDGFAVAWTDSSEQGGDTDDDAIRLQRFDSSGTKVGADQLVNTATAGQQAGARIVATHDHGFVVVWQDFSSGNGGAAGDSSGFAIKGQRFNLDGTPAGGEFLVNSTTFGHQALALITARANGDFFVVWNDGANNAPDGSASVRGQMYDATGAKIGDELVINTHYQGTQYAAHVETLSDGSYVVVWIDNSADGPVDDSVRARIYSPDGGALTGEILVNTATAGSQNWAAIAVGDGGFVITWTDNSQGVGGEPGDSSGSAIKAQRFDNAGARIGDEILVNTQTSGTQGYSTVAMRPDGGFVVAWVDEEGDGDSHSVKAQVFSSDGVKIGGELLVNTATAAEQYNPKIWMVGDDRFVVAWDDNSLGVGGATGDADGQAVKAQLFEFVPMVVDVDVPAAGTYGAGQAMTFTVKFDEAVFLVTQANAPRLELNVGGQTVYATYVEANANEVTFRYTVGSGLIDANGIQVVGLQAGGGLIGDDGDAADLTLSAPVLPSTASILVDGDPPGVSGVTPPTSDTYVFDKALNFTVTFDEAVTVVTAGGAPRLELRVGEETVYADYVSGSGGTSLVFRYRVEEGQLDTDGVEIVGLDANGGAIRDGAGNPAALSLAGVGSTAGVRIDSIGPAVTAVTAPMADTYAIGEVLTFTVKLDEVVTYEPGDGLARLALTIGGQTRYADYVPGGQDSDTLTFSYTIQAGDQDADGIAVASFVDLDGDAFFGADDNPAPLTGLAFSGLSDVKVDGLAPTVSSITPTVTTTASTATFTVTFSENVSGVDASDFTLTGTGGATATIGAVTQIDPKTYRVAISDASGDGTLRLDLKATGTGIQDAAADNPISGGFTSGAAVTVDHTPPGGTDKTLTVGEDSGLTIEASDFGFHNPAAGAFIAVVIATLPAAGALTLDGAPVEAGQVISVADLDEGLLEFRAAPDANGAAYASFTFQVRDNAGATDTDPTPNIITIDVTAANDWPVGVDRTISIETGAARTLRTADFPFTDKEGDALLDVKITTLPATGSLELDGVAVTVGQSISAADLAAGKLTFAADAAGSTSFTFQVRDAGGGITDSDLTPNTLTINVREPEPEPAPSPPPVQDVVDGVQLGRSTATNADGTTNAVITIPVVTASRTETTGEAGVADIPLSGDRSAPDLMAQVPTGFGLQVSGPSSEGTAASSLTDLIREIQAHTDVGSSDRTTLTGGGSSFLGGLDPNAPLLVRTIVPTVSGAPPTGALVIQGSVAADAPSTALVIDARSVPAGTEIQLQNVAFAAVVGAVTITGGEGSQTVWGDGADQNIMLGADDDDLRGGAGNDTVGSAGGADHVQGDDGDDRVFGGIGDDYVHGNAGNDTANGNAGNDLVYGGKGDDRVYGDEGDDRVFGDLGRDFVHGNAGADTVDGGAGDDTVFGGRGNDLVLGGAGDDIVSGDLGLDTVNGGQGRDYILGGDGGDILRGGQGDDVIYGEAGDDWISGDLGDDTLSGGAGADTFHSFGQAGLDRVTDFNALEGDRVLLLAGTTYTLSQAGDDTIIDMAGGARMVLAGVSLASLPQGWIGIG